MSDNPTYQDLVEFSDDNFRVVDHTRMNYVESPLGLKWRFINYNVPNDLFELVAS